MPKSRQALLLTVAVVVSVAALGLFIYNVTSFVRDRQILENITPPAAATFSPPTQDFITGLSKGGLFVSQP